MTVIEQAANAGKSEPVWPVFKPNTLDPVLGKKEMMSPEQTLIEFISTSAGLHGVTQISLRSLEWDLLKVFAYNIMPANAAAWYMAKRKFYADQPADQQLLPFILKKYPDKFRLKKFQVEFLETYSKETAKKKLNFLVEFGLDAYFSHKVDEFGVYFFDPSYYERTEPFHEALVLCTQGNRQRLVNNYFGGMKNRYSYVMHAPNLASITKDFNTKVITKMTGVIVSMMNNQYGYIKFGSGEKALFCAKALFRDGWQYSGDPLRLPAMYFDAYKAPDGMKSGDEACKWLAVLVWCGRKPAPKFYSTLANLNMTPVGFSKSAAVDRQSGQTAEGGRKVRQPSSNMMIGEVVSIRKNGAVVSDMQGKVFVPGWSKENLQRPGVWLNTLTGDTIGLHDLVAYYIDSTETMDGFRAVGKNVFVLKNNEEGGARKRSSRGSLPMSEGGNYEPLSESEIDFVSDNSTSSEDESEGVAVSDGELEWLEKELNDLIVKEGPEARTHGFLINLKQNLSEVRATRSTSAKAKTPTRQRHDSGLGSNPTTPRDNLSLKVGKRGADSSVFWRTSAALASIEEGYRSSEDEDYESGDEVHSIEISPARKRRQSTMSSASTKSTRNRNRKSSVATDGDSNVSQLPYWVRAVSLPEEYDQESKMFVPVDKYYNEEKDPDYILPLTDYEEEEEQGQEIIEIDEKKEKEESENGDGKGDSPKVETEGDSAKSQPEKTEKAEKLEVKECLEEEVKLLLKEAEEELDEALLEGKHRESEKQLPTPEKIVVNKPESEGEEVVEIITIPEPPRNYNTWLPRSYTKFLENLQVDLPEEDVHDNEYVPPAVIFDEDCDYDEFDPDEVIPEEELTDIQKEFDYMKENLKMDLAKTGNYIPIWVHVDSVEARKEKAIVDITRREEERKEKEAALKAAQEKEAAKEAAREVAAAAAKKTGGSTAPAEEADSENPTRKLSLKGLEGTVKELGTYDPKPQRKLSATKKKTRSQGGCEDELNSKETITSTDDKTVVGKSSMEASA